MFKVVLKLPDKQKPKFKMNRNVCQRASERNHVKTQTMYIFFIFFSHATLNETFTAKYDGVLPRTP